MRIPPSGVSGPVLDVGGADLRGQQRGDLRLVQRAVRVPCDGQRHLRRCDRGTRARHPRFVGVARMVPRPYALRRGRSERRGWACGGAGEQHRVVAGVAYAAADLLEAGVHRLVEQAVGRWRVADRKRAHDPLLAVQERGGDVVTDHPPLGGGGEPAELHRVAEYLWRAPGLPVVERGREPDLYLAGEAAATRISVEVVREREQRVVARRGAADGEARDEVVDIAANRVERDAADRRPGGAVGRAAEHDVVGGAAGFEAVVLPGDVDRAVAVDLGGGQRRGTYPR